MHRIELSRRFLKNPMSGVLLLLALIGLTEWLGWSVAPEAKSKLVEREGGLWPYVSVLVRSFFLPELITIWVLLFVINLGHRWLRITSVPNTFFAIIRYGCQLLPFIALSFLVFYPFTLTVRYLLMQFPLYDFSDFWQMFIRSFTLDAYLKYLFPILFIGYVALTISLARDYSNTRNRQAGY